MTSTVPPLPDLCWPVDHGCCAEWDGYDPEVAARADALAVWSLRGLTGYRVGGCPIAVRPCRADCASEQGRAWPSTFFGLGPYPFSDALGGALLIPCGCGAHPCSCTTVCEIEVPSRWVDKVTIDGIDLPADAWRVDSPSWLVRTDGECWPTCQDLTLPDTEVGTWSVTYSPGLPVDGLAAYAAGLLACEFAKACSGAKCALPSGVTSLTRGGMTMTMAAGVFANGVTGLREVDAWLSGLFPAKPRPSTVRSPDIPARRRTVGV